MSICQLAIAAQPPAIFISTGGKKPVRIELPSAPFDGTARAVVARASVARAVAKAVDHAV